MNIEVLYFYLKGWQMGEVIHLLEKIYVFEVAVYGLIDS